MNVQRLKFAHARGARIQRKTSQPGHWIDDGDSPRWRAESRRIHPDDEHLQYGPLSTALRAFALTYEWTDATEVALKAAQLLFLGVPFSTINVSNDDIRTLYLFQAELMADEGL